MQYNPRQRLHTSDLEYEIGAYGGEEVTPGNHHRPARHLRNTEQAIIAERLARQQAIDEARARQQEKLANARQNRKTRNPAPAQRRPYTQANSDNREDEEEFDGQGDVWPPLQRTSTILHNLPPEGVYQTGNKRVHVQYVDVPPRRSAKPRLPPAPLQQHTMYEDDD